MDKSISENRLELNFIKQLKGLGYSEVKIETEEELLSNFKIQLELFNKIQLSDSEFNSILTYLKKGSIVEKSKKIRDKYELKLDNSDIIYISFFNSKKWCQNIYQVTNQITVKGKYENRYDVTLLINGIPFVQTELKRNGIAIREAFNQIVRYKKHSYSFNSQIFDYIQIFIISNETNTQYLTNNYKLRFEDVFSWSDKNNNIVTNLSDFTSLFLEPCKVSKMISQYIVISEEQEKNFILRPYQCYAAEEIVDRIENTNLNGYIWHTTGSGKTLTSFKTAQILKDNSKLKKILFVVDRKDLDVQTINEFNNFSKGCVDGTENTTQLIKQLSDVNTKLIVTTIQKLNVAIKLFRELKKVNKNNKIDLFLKKYKLSKQEFNELLDLSKENNVFLFDECHRSQFGESHKNITEYFPNSQLIGFTGTPIFGENSNNKQTTKDLFTKQLHSYTILDAISDNNVLGFSYKYINTIQGNISEIEKIKKNEKATGIDINELYNNKDRMNVVVDNIISQHNTFTDNKKYNAIFAVSSIENAIKYYDIFKKKNSNLKVSTIFSFTANEEDRDDGNLEESDKLESGLSKHSRDKLEDIMTDYNKEYGTNFNTNRFDGYYKDISKKIKSNEIDIVIVVNMFLTGFDSKSLSTLYVDKNLKFHGLIQAFSRTNRIESSRKPFGNIISYRDLKDEIDIAVSLFSNKNAKETIFQPDYKTLLKDFNKVVSMLKGIAKNPSSVDTLKGEENKKKFVETFRSLMKLKNKLSFFNEFEISKESNGITEKEYDSYTSKYLDIYDKVKQNYSNEKISILNEINFETELLIDEKINVDYILHLLSKLHGKDDEESNKERKLIIKMLDKNLELRSKKELILNFLNSNFISDNKEETKKSFEDFKTAEIKEEINKFCNEKEIKIEEFSKLYDKYSYSPKDNYFEGDKAIEPNDISLKKLKFMERSGIVTSVIDKIKELYKKYI